MTIQLRSKIHYLLPGGRNEISRILKSAAYELERLQLVYRESGVENQKRKGEKELREGAGLAYFQEHRLALGYGHQAEVEKRKKG